MKRLIKLTFSLTAILVLLMCFSLGVSAEYTYSEDGVYIYDDYEDLSSSERDELIELATQYHNKTGYNIGLVISYDLGGKSSMRYSDDIYDEVFGINTDGVLVLVDNDEYYDYISTSGDAILMYDDVRIERIHNYGHSALKDEDYARALTLYINRMSEFYDDGVPSSNEGYAVNTDTSKLEYIGEDDAVTFFDVVTICFVSLIGFAIAWLIAFFAVKGAYKFKSAPSAREYIDPGETFFSKKTDTFIREYTTSYRVSSSSGGGRSGGSSTHRSSSGGTHGGGGHRR